MFTSELFIAHAKQNGGGSVHGRKGGSREKLGADAHRYSTSEIFVWDSTESCLGPAK